MQELHNLFNQLHSGLVNAGYDDIAFRLDELHHDFQCAIDDDEAWLERVEERLKLAREHYKQSKRIE